MGIMTEFHKGILYSKIGIVTENKEVFFPKTSQKWGAGGKTKKNPQVFPLEICKWKGDPYKNLKNGKKKKEQKKEGNIKKIRCSS